MEQLLLTVLSAGAYENQEFEFVGVDALASGSITDLYALNFTDSEITDNLDLQLSVDAGDIRLSYVKDAGGAGEETTILSSLTIGRISSELGAGTIISSTDDLSEGTTNLYFTEVRARIAAVVNSTSGNQTDQSASVAAVKSLIASEINNLIGGASSAYDTLIELQNEIQDNDTDLSNLLTLVGDKLDASSVSPFGLTLIDDADAATARTTLGLGTAALADTADFATVAQGTLANTALQSGDNISELANDAGYVDVSGAAAAAPVQSVNGQTGVVVLEYGRHYSPFQDNTLSESVSTTFATKMAGNTQALSIGKYKIVIDYSFNKNGTTTDIETLFLFDGSGVGLDAGGIIQKQEVKDSAGSFLTTLSSQRYNFHKEYLVDVTVAGAKSVLLQFRTDNTGQKASIWDASIEVFKVQ